MLPNLTLIIARYATARLIEMPLRDNRHAVIRILLALVAGLTALCIWGITVETVRRGMDSSGLAP